MCLDGFFDSLHHGVERLCLSAATWQFWYRGNAVAVLVFFQQLRHISQLITRSLYCKVCVNCLFVVLEARCLNGLSTWLHTTPRPTQHSIYGVRKKPCCHSCQKLKNKQNTKSKCIQLPSCGAVGIPHPHKVWFGDLWCGFWVKLPLILLSCHYLLSGYVV
jgi:hypothetical protein